MIIIRLVIFVLIWVLLGQFLVHLFFPGLEEMETVKQAIPWLLVIGYSVGVLGSKVADAVADHFER